MLPTVGAIFSDLVTCAAAISRRSGVGHVVCAKLSDRTDGLSNSGSATAAMAVSPGQSSPSFTVREIGLATVAAADEDNE